MPVVVAVFAAVLFFILSLPAASVAATRTWTGGGAPSDVWSNPNNWESNIVPVAGDDLVFPDGTGTTTNDLPNLLVRSLSISSSHTFSGAGIQLENGITLSSAGGEITPKLDLPMQLIAQQTWSVGPNTSLQTLTNGTIGLVNAMLTISLATNRSADLSGVISGTGGLIGGDGLHLRGANTFQGMARFSGRVYLYHASALGVGDGTPANGTTVDDGTLFLPDGTLAPEAFALGTSPVTTGRLFGGHNGADSVITGPVTLGPVPLEPNPANAVLSAAAPGSLRVEGVISGPGCLGLSGWVTLANTNTYTGGTIFFPPFPQIVLEADDALGPGTTSIFFPEGQLTIRKRRLTVSQLSGNGRIQFESGPTPAERATLVVGGLASQIPHVYSGTLDGDGLLRFVAPGNYSLTGSSGGMTGDIEIEQGVVVTTGLLVSAHITVGAQGELHVRGNDGKL